MGYKDKAILGELPGHGAIFMSNTGTKKECLRRKLFGLPPAMSDFVLHVKKGMILFLFEFERRELHGVFHATCDGEINIEPRAFKSSGKHFPAQVRFTSVWNCSPLAEHEFQDAIRDNYFTGKKFNFGLSEDQVSKLMKLFHSKRIHKIHPERDVWRHGDKPAEGDSRSDDHRKNLFRDRIRFVNEEDGNDLDTCRYVDDEVIKEVDDHENFVEKVNNFNFDRGQGNRTVKLERVLKDSRNKFLTNYKTQSDDFGDCGTRQGILGKHHYLNDLNDGHEMHNNHGEIRDITNEEKVEHDIDDGYFPIFTEPHEKHYGEIGVASNDDKFLMDGIAYKNEDFMDDSRIQDEYHANENMLSKPIGTTNVWMKPDYDDGYSTFRPRTLTEHPPYEPRGISVGIKPEYDENFVFESVPPTNNLSYSNFKLNTSSSEVFKFSDIGESYERGLPYSTSCDTTMITMPIPYDPEIPHFQVRPSSSLCNPISNEIHASLSMSKTTSYNEGSLRYFDDPGYASLSKSEGNRVCKTTSRDGSRTPVFPEYPIHNDKKLGRPRENRRLDGTNKRVSVFARLTSDLGSVQELETDVKDDLDASVNKVMKMLEKVASSPIKKTGKSKRAFKEEGGGDDDNVTAKKIVDNEVSKMRKEPDDADLADEVIEGGSILQETRLVDFKRHKKTSNESDVGSVEINRSMGMPCKRRKLVRPVFVENESTVVGVGATKDENTLCKVDGNSTKAELESSGKVDTSIKSVDVINLLPSSHENENTPEDNNNSTKTVLESSDKVDTSIKSMDITNLLPSSHENTPSKDNNSTKTILESSDKVDTSTKSMDVINLLPSSHENTPSKDDNNSTKTVLESSDKVDTSMKSMDISKLLPSSHENTPSKDGNNSTKTVLESSETVDASIKSLQLSAECQKSVDEVEECSKVEGDGNAENRLESDVFFEATRVDSSQGNQKMCGWIEY